MTNEILEKANKLKMSITILSMAVKCFQDTKDKQKLIVEYKDDNVLGGNNQHHLPSIINQEFVPLIKLALTDALNKVIKEFDEL